MARAIPITRVRDKLTGICQQAAIANKRTVVTSRDVELAAIISISDLELLETLEDEIDLWEAEKQAKRGKKEGRIPWEKVKKDLGL